MLCLYMSKQVLLALEESMKSGFPYFYCTKCFENLAKNTVSYVLLDELFSKLTRVGLALEQIKQRRLLKTTSDFTIVIVPLWSKLADSPPQTASELWPGIIHPKQNSDRPTRNAAWKISTP